MRRFDCFAAAVLVCALSFTLQAQVGSPTVSGPPPKTPDPVEKLSDTTYRLGSIIVDTSKREARIPGRVNDTKVLEFIANTLHGFRAYESAFELNTNGITFNVAMILLGLDKSNATPPTRHFDPNAPKGDPVEVWVEWMSGSETKRVRAEDLLWDREKNQNFPRAPWVYTGSVELPNGAYMADQDAVLIGFVHDPASIIEWTGANGVGRFGFVQIDPKSGLLPPTPVTVVIRGVGPAKK